MHCGFRLIKVQPQLPVDSKHPVVEQLCSAGFSEEQSVEAVEKYETLERAMDFLMSLGDDDGDGMFQSGTQTVQDSTVFLRQSSGGALYNEPLDPP